MITFKKFILVGLASVFLSGSIQAADTPTLKYGGRLQADYTDFHNDTYQYSDGSELRRGRLFVRGDLSENWDYKIQYDFAPDKTELKDGYIRYNGFENSRITFGNFKVFSSLEELTSSNNITFTERALPNALLTSRRVGVGFQNWSDRYSVAVAAYTHEANNKARGEGASGRFAYRPKLGDDTLLHLGVALAYETDDDDTVSLRTRPESHQDGHRIVNTGNIADIDRINKFGFEAAIVRGRFSAQAEHVSQRIQRKVDPDLSFVGSYAYVSYFLTDDSRPYSKTGAAFGTLTPSSDKGAWELAARFSTLDLDDTDILGGEVDTFTVGVNYYMTRDLRFTANYIMADSTMAGIDDDPKTLQLRVRLTF